MEKENVTPEEKAERLGVRVLPAVRRVRDTKKEDEKGAVDERIAQIQEHMKRTVAVCGACGKEISHTEYVRKEPCGNLECPFGYFTNQK